MRSILFLKKKTNAKPNEILYNFLKRYKKERQDKTMATILDVAN